MEFIYTQPSYRRPLMTCVSDIRAHLHTNVVAAAWLNDDPDPITVLKAMAKVRAAFVVPQQHRSRPMKEISTDSYGRVKIISNKIRSFLEMDWYGTDDKIPSKDGLNWLATDFEKKFRADNHFPNVFPSFSGGVRMEWCVNRQTMILDVDLSLRTARWLSFYLDKESDDGDHAEDIDLSDDTGWKRLDILLQTKPFTG